MNSGASLSPASSNCTTTITGTPGRKGGSFEIIELKGKPIGRMCLWRGLDGGVEQIHIVEFTILTDYRNRGIGSHVMNEVLAWADDVGLPVRTRLVPCEISRPFLERHGFTLFEDEGMSLHFERPA